MSVEAIRQSTLNMLFRCGIQFQYRFEKGIIIPPGISARRGTTVHTTSQATHNHKLLKGVDLPVDYMEDLAADTYRRLVLDRGVYIPKSEYFERKRLIGEGLDSAVRLSRLYAQKVAPMIQPWLVERTVIVDFEGIELPLEGTIDLVEVNSHLRDIKSAAKSYNQAAADCSLQLTQYNVMFYLTFGYWPPATSLMVLVDLKEAKFQEIHTIRTAACLEPYKKRVALAIKCIKSGIFLPTNPDNWWCTEKWCGYWQMCPHAGGKM